MKRILLLTAIVSAAGLALAGFAGTDVRVAAFQAPSETYAIRNARIVTVTGPPIESGTVVIANGKIAAVGANASVPSVRF